MAAITNPKYLFSAESADFCGVCDRTWADVAIGMPVNTGATHMCLQSYRLEMSRCRGKAGDARITYLACHDPHQLLVHELSDCDSRCLACRSGAKGSTLNISARHAKLVSAVTFPAACPRLRRRKRTPPLPATTFG